MASIINASSSGSGGIVQTADASGVLQLQSNGTVIVQVNSTNAKFTGGYVSFGDYGYIRTDQSNSLALQSGSSTSVGFQLRNSGNGSTPMLSMNGAGGYSLALEGATSQSGVGITFPTSQQASSDANTLDDYEEGTFTPTLSFGGSSTGITYQAQNGQYVKIGRNVYINFYLLLLNKGSATGVARVSGFPFGTATGIDFFVPLAPRGYLNSGGSPVSLYSGADGSTGFDFYYCPLTGGSNGGLTNSAFANNTEVNFNFWYKTTA